MPPTKPRRVGNIASKNPLVRVAGVLQDIIYFGLESVGKYYSIYMAKVASNDDPQCLNRLQLIIPEVTGPLPYPVWSYPRNVWGGMNYGIQVLPQVGDLVYVEFERGDAERPIWSHGFFAEGEKPKGGVLASKNTYWFISPKNTQVIIDDDAGDISVTLNGGESYRISKKAISLIHNEGISLGKLDKSDYSAVLGEELLDGLLEFKDIVDDFATAVAQDALVSTQYLTCAKIKVAMPKVVVRIKLLEDKFKKFLSKKNTLD